MASLRSYRERHGLTLTQLARRVGVDPSAIHRYENGDRIPRRDVVEKIVRATGGEVRPNDLYASDVSAAPTAGTRKRGTRHITQKAGSASIAVPEALAEAAKAHRLDPSSIAEKALADAVRDAERAAWLRENADAIEAHNERVETRGLFSDGLRRF